MHTHTYTLSILSVGGLHVQCHACDNVSMHRLEHSNIIILYLEVEQSFHCFCWCLSGGGLGLMLLAFMKDVNWLGSRPESLEPNEKDKT